MVLEGGGEGGGSFLRIVSENDLARKLGPVVVHPPHHDGRGFKGVPC